MKGYTEVGYCVHIKYDEDKFFLFDKRSIIYNNDNYQPCYEPITDVNVYNIFFMLYPILKEIPRDRIQIQKGWDTFHPDDKIPTNEYNKQKDEYITKLYKNWCIENKIEMKKKEEKEPLVRYFLIRRKNCSCPGFTDVFGITVDEEYAKSCRCVFCDYEEVKMMDTKIVLFPKL